MLKQSSTQCGVIDRSSVSEHQMHNAAFIYCTEYQSTAMLFKNAFTRYVIVFTGQFFSSGGH